MDDGADFKCKTPTHFFSSPFSTHFHRFHTKEPEQSKRTCALCLSDLSEDSPNPKVCVQCSERHSFRQSLNQLMARSEEATTAAKTNDILSEHPADNGPSRDRGFVCYFCPVTFPSLRALQEHIPEHGEESKLYGCRSCPRRFHFKDDLEDHVVDAHVTKEVIKREREDSEGGEEEDEAARDDDDEEGNVEEEEEEAGRQQAEGEGDESQEDEEEEREEKHQQGPPGELLEEDGAAASPAGSDFIENVESEIKVDNDNYAIVFYCR